MADALKKITPLQLATMITNSTWNYCMPNDPQSPSILVVDGEIHLDKLCKELEKFFDARANQ